MLGGFALLKAVLILLFFLALARGVLLLLGSSKSYSKQTPNPSKGRPHACARHQGLISSVPPAPSFARTTRREIRRVCARGNRLDLGRAPTWRVSQYVNMKLEKARDDGRDGDEPRAERGREEQLRVGDSQEQEGT